MNLPRIRVWVSLGLVGAAALAQDPGALRISGFGTLGVAHSSSEGAEFIRDLSQPRGSVGTFDPRLDSRLGVQATWTLSPDWSLVGQAVSKYRHDHTATPELTWAFLSYAPSSHLQVRLGRLGWDVFQLADTRNVGFSYLWARPPVEFFGSLMVAYHDGVDLAWTSHLEQGRSLRMKVSGGWARGHVPQGPTGTSMSLDRSPVVGAVAELQTESTTSRLAFARMRAAQDWPLVEQMQAGLLGASQLLGDPGLARQAEALGFKGTTFHYSSAGFVWHGRHLKADAAAALVTSDSGVVPDFKSAYLSLSENLGPFEPYLLASRVVSQHPDPYVGLLPGLGPGPAALAQGVQTLATSLRMNQTSLAIGCRWDVHARAAVKAQVQQVRSTPGWNFLWANASPTWNGRATVATLTFDFVF